MFPFVGKRRLEEILEHKREEKAKKMAAQGLAEEERVEFEKGDIFAITIAAIRVFFPILLGFVGIVSLVTWLLTG